MSFELLTCHRAITPARDPATQDKATVPAGLEEEQSVASSRNSPLHYPHGTHGTYLVPLVSSGRVRTTKMRKKVSQSLVYLLVVLRHVIMHLLHPVSHPGTEEVYLLRCLRNRSLTRTTPSITVLYPCRRTGLWWYSMVEIGREAGKVQV